MNTAVNLLHFKVQFDGCFASDCPVLGNSLPQDVKTGFQIINPKAQTFCRTCIYQNSAQVHVADSGASARPLTNSGAVFTKILILSIRLILRIFLRIVVFLRNILE